MLLSSNATTEAARYLFCFYIGLVSLLVSQLLIGIILTLFEDITSTGSAQIYKLASDTAGWLDDEVCIVANLTFPLELK